MSALAEKLHALFSRFTTIGRNDVEEVVQAVEEHFAPLVDQAEQSAVAEAKKLIAEGKQLEDAALAEVKAELAAVKAQLQQLLGQQPAPAPAEPAQS